MSKKCPKCKSFDIHITEYPIPTDSMATCYGCGYTDLLERFPEQTVFDYITDSEENLAEKLVYEHVVINSTQIYDSYSSNTDCSCTKMWKSALLPTKFFDDKQKAIEATLAELQKEVKDE